MNGKKRGDTKKRRGLIPALLAFLAILAVIVVILMLALPPLDPFPGLDPRSAGTINVETANAPDIMAANDLVNSRYATEIYPEGKARIDAELEKIRQIPDPQAKLDEIFTWEMKDWIRPNDNIEAFTCDNPACTYLVLQSDPTRMKASPYYDGLLYPQRNPNGTMYADDPYWIAYNRIGECREYSALFTYMAQKSGIDARLVFTDLHQWTELKLTGGTYYYDPWCADTYDYYRAADGNMTFRNKWFNTIGSFEENCRPPDMFPMSYNSFPYVWATPEYLAATNWHTLGEDLNVTLPG